MAENIPTAVLSEQMRNAVDGRRVRAAIFTTFSFEPGFFEEEILPALFDQSLSHAARVRLVQMEDAVRRLEHVAVYYDRRALVTGGTSAVLDVQRIPMHRKGFFHPKLVLLLVERQHDDASIEESLVVGVLSANLTRAGWFQNVECGAFFEYSKGWGCSLRPDLQHVLRSIERDDKTAVDRPALRAIKKFVDTRVVNESQRSAKRTLHPRLFVGRESFPEFIKEQLGLAPNTYNLEVISPYFDDSSEARTLAGLIKEVQPRETRLFMPRGDNREALCSGEFRDAVTALGAHWAELPWELVRRSKSEADKHSRRFVHAKVYRFWSRTEGRDYIIVGSVNLTGPAHTPSNAGNLEVSILMDRGPEQRPGFWMNRIDDPASVECQGENATEDEETVQVPPVTLRYDWSRKEKQASYFWESGGTAPTYAVISAANIERGRIEPVLLDQWCDVPQEVADALAQLLRSTSFVDVAVDGGNPATLLVVEEGMSQKPSLLFSLTAQEILKYWSLLSPEQREAFLNEKLEAELVRDGIVAERASEAETTDGIFDKFAGVFHAFSRLEVHVRAAIEEGREREAEYRLFGKKYDSLPSLLEKVVGDPDSDAVTKYVTLLTAKQLLATLEAQQSTASSSSTRASFAEFIRSHSTELAELHATLEVGLSIREALSVPGEAPQEFLTWFERWFLRRPEAQA